MKREQLILQTMSDKQLDAAKKLIAREVTRRTSKPPARASSKRRTAGAKRAAASHAHA